MVAKKSLWSALLALVVVIVVVGVVEGQPIMFEPNLPPISDPPYPHDVRFCGIANGVSFNLSNGIGSQCDWPKYAKVRKRRKRFGLLFDFPESRFYCSYHF